MAHVHSVYDADAHFTVDPIKRVVRNKTPKKVTVMQYDHNSERFTFELEQRYVEGHDMSTCNLVEVHYNNGGNRGLYIVDDLRVSTEDPDKVTCSWLVSRNATQKAAPLEFRLTFKCVSEDDTDYVWSTAIHKGISVSPGIDSTGMVEKEYPDVIGQLIGKIETIIKGETDPVPTGARLAAIKLYSSTWVGDASPYSQVVSIDGITVNSQVDLTPNLEQLLVFYEKDLTFLAENVGGVVTVYAIGQKPTNDYTMQVTITEVEA